MLNIYEAYFDESGTHDDSPFICVGGFLFKKPEAIRFKKLWRKKVKPLLPEGVDKFHATDCYQRSKDFTGISEDQSNAIFKAMAAITRETARYGVLIGIERKVYESAVTSATTKSFVGSPYTVCATFCAEHVGEWLTSKKKVGGVSYFYEYSQHTGEAINMLQDIQDNRNNSRLKKRYHIHRVEAIHKAGAIPLQAADLLVWEINRMHLTATMKEHENWEWRKTVSTLTGFPFQIKLLYNDIVKMKALINRIDGIKSNRTY